MSEANETSETREANLRNLRNLRFVIFQPRKLILDLHASRCLCAFHLACEHIAIAGYRRRRRRFWDLDRQ